MGDVTRIEWTDATWSPVTGCTKVSEGCRHCYIERTPPFRMEGRKFRCPRCGGSGYVEDSDGNRLAYGKSGQFIAGARCARCSGTGRAGIGDTTGVRMHEDRLDVPLRWRKPRKVFVCSMADLFHEAVSSSFIASVFAVMALTPQHTYQVLTKRPARMRALLTSGAFADLLGDTLGMMLFEQRISDYDVTFPLPNVWLGVTVEDQQRADQRIPILLDTPAAVRWLSCEPLLGPVDLDATGMDVTGTRGPESRPPAVDWVVAGGESGPNARPMHPDWARSLRDQCAVAGVPYLYKQWGEWAPGGEGVGPLRDTDREVYIGDVLTDPAWKGLPARQIMRRVGKKRAGRVLDGLTHDGYPGGEPS